MQVYWTQKRKKNVTSSNHHNTERKNCTSWPVIYDWVVFISRDYQLQKSLSFYLFQCIGPRICRYIFPSAGKSKKPHTIPTYVPLKKLHKPIRDKVIFLSYLFLWYHRKINEEKHYRGEVIQQDWLKLEWATWGLVQPGFYNSKGWKSYYQTRALLSQSLTTHNSYCSHPHSTFPTTLHSLTIPF